MLKHDLSTLSGFRTLSGTDTLCAQSTLPQSTPSENTPLENTPPQVWGGIECTVNRVGDRYFDQLERSGHAQRSSDLEMFADLGVRALRYPVLWERTAPQGVAQADWSWPDERLCALRALRIQPVAGLVHHGSGPLYTDLCDPQFPQKLAAYARAVAERYPWLDAYTPINEPLTTARFSGLYGHWYPHGRDDRTFVTALLHQCRGVALAMAAVREVNPHAKLVQTEETGRIFSTPALSYQAEFENERRWLTFDLLCGRVDPDHPLWGYLLWAGASQAMLESFLAQPCPPDIIGLNYYVTSERFLDERLEHYPPELHGGNGRHAYADAAAIRVAHDECHGLHGVLTEAWQRYRLPLAVTEAHLGCTVDEQMRWLADMWDEVRAAKSAGTDVRAFTVWALLGAYDWHCLVTQDLGCYESGVFTLREGQPHPTELVEVVKALACGRRPSNPVLEEPGWWRRDDRLLYPPPPL